MNSEPRDLLRVGLVGAGPWAGLFHAPMITGGPGTRLEAVWARRREASEDLVSGHGGVAVDSFEELLERCDAVAFAVPPDVQAELAPRAARAGKHLVLEKPLAFTVADAERIVDAVDESRVMTVLMLRNRFTHAGRAFVERAQASPARGGRAVLVSGAALPGNPFATSWRVQRGALYDVGPHSLDLLDAAMGTITRVTATGDPLRWLALTTEHAGGAIGQVTLSITSPHAPDVLRVEVQTDEGEVVFDGAESDRDETAAASLMAALVDAVEHGTPPLADAHRGLHLQRLLAQAESSVAP